LIVVRRRIAQFCYLPVRRSRMEKAMDFREAIYSRRAVRDFTTDPVDEKALRQRHRQLNQAWDDLLAVEGHETGS